MHVWITKVFTTCTASSSFLKGGDKPEGIYGGCRLQWIMENIPKSCSVTQVIWVFLSCFCSQRICKPTTLICGILLCFSTHCSSMCGSIQGHSWSQHTPAMLSEHTHLLWCFSSSSVMHNFTFFVCGTVLAQDPVLTSCFVSVCSS